MGSKENVGGLFKQSAKNGCCVLWKIRGPNHAQNQNKELRRHEQEKKIDLGPGFEAMERGVDLGALEGGRLGLGAGRPRSLGWSRGPRKFRSTSGVPWKSAAGRRVLW